MRTDPLAAPTLGGVFAPTNEDTTVTGVAFAREIEGDAALLAWRGGGGIETLTCSGAIPVPPEGFEAFF
jgi:hypothetical protein